VLVFSKHVLTTSNILCIVFFSYALLFTVKHYTNVYIFINKSDMSKFFVQLRLRKE